MEHYVIPLLNDPGIIKKPVFLQAKMQFVRKIIEEKYKVITSIKETIKNPDDKEEDDD